MATAKSAPTASEEQLQQQDPNASEDALKAQAREERKEQKAELSAKSAAQSVKLDPDVPAEGHRSDHVQLYSLTSGNRPDQLTVKDPSTAVYYGHFCTVTGGEHEGLYGVYVDNVTFKPNGQPDTVVVRSSGDAVVNYVVKYDDLAPAQSRGNGAR